MRLVTAHRGQTDGKSLDPRIRPLRDEHALVVGFSAIRTARGQSENHTPKMARHRLRALGFLVFIIRCDARDALLVPPEPDFVARHGTPDSTG